MAAAPSLPYAEPAWTAVLLLLLFVVLLNTLRALLDAALHCGLLAQIALGALLGTPLAGVLSAELEQAAQLLGYAGLLLLLAQGGLETRLGLLAAPRTLALAVLVGLLGVALPIALSMAFLPYALRYSLLQAFALGASLASTSLGTVFAMLAAVDASLAAGEKQRTAATEAAPEHGPSAAPSKGLLDTRLCTILVGAALLDDILGLVLSGLIAQLSPARTGAGAAAWPLARPLVASFAMLAVFALVLRLAAPLVRRLAAVCARREARHGSESSARAKRTALLQRHTHGLAALAYLAFIAAMLAISHAIGSTLLLGAFCAGAGYGYLHRHFSSAYAQHPTAPSASSIRLVQRLGEPLALLEPVQSRLLVPFFFASIGFAIPLRQLFAAAVVWKGWAYASLMALAKLLAAGWLFPAALLDGGAPASAHPHDAAVALERTPSSASAAAPPLEREREVPHRARQQSLWQANWRAALLLGLSLVARGEIGFIILNNARDAGILNTDGSDARGAEAFNVGVWAIVLNTLAGPLAVGFLLSAPHVVPALQNGRWGFAR